MTVPQNQQKKLTSVSQSNPLTGDCYIQLLNELLVFLFAQQSAKSYVSNYYFSNNNNQHKMKCCNNSLFWNNSEFDWYMCFPVRGSTAFQKILNSDKIFLGTTIFDS